MEAIFSLIKGDFSKNKYIKKLFVNHIIAAIQVECPLPLIFVGWILGNDSLIRCLIGYTYILTIETCILRAKVITKNPCIAVKSSNTFFSTKNHIIGYPMYM